MSAPFSTLDVNCHFLPPGYYEQAVRWSAGPVPYMLERAARLPAMVDEGARLGMLEPFPNARQIPSLSSPPIESYARPGRSADLARRANDELALLCARHPSRFPTFVASLPLDDPKAALEEAQRSVRELGAAGVQIYTNILGRAIDAPECFELYDLMSSLQRPLWLHPYRSREVADFAAEPCSQWEIWWALGWPYESSAAMLRLALSGVFDRWPALQIVTHHAGGILPMLAGRISPGLDAVGKRSPPGLEPPAPGPTGRALLQALRCFYTDTASFGSAETIRVGLAFFGPEKMLFATDAPFSGADGHQLALHAVAGAAASSEQRRAILHDNAEKLLWPPAGRTPE